MRIYLDTCCLNRPFDDQSQPRIRLEAEAVALVLERFHRRKWKWIGSSILMYELGQTKNKDRRERLLLLAGESHLVIEITEEILSHAEKLELMGFDAYDAIHLASAEQAKVDIFLTTDDNLLKISDRNKQLFSFIVINPVKWLEED
jgi:predicted nucleic acid-binding protein